MTPPTIEAVLVYLIFLFVIVKIVTWTSDWWRGYVARREEGAFECCEHCGCRPGEQNGHDFACASGCDVE